MIESSYGRSRVHTDDREFLRMIESSDDREFIRMIESLYG